MISLPLSSIVHSDHSYMLRITKDWLWTWQRYIRRQSSSTTYRILRKIWGHLWRGLQTITAARVEPEQGHRLVRFEPEISGTVGLKHGGGEIGEKRVTTTGGDGKKGGQPTTGAKR